MLTILPLTALLLTWDPAALPPAWTPGFTGIFHAPGNPASMLPELPRPAPTPSLSPRQAEPPRSAGRPGFPLPRLLPPVPVLSPSADRTASTWTAHPPAAPASGASPDLAGFGRISDSSDVGTATPASLTWNIHHPWLGLIFIGSPGFISQPGVIVSYPYYRPVILPHPLTPAEPVFHLPPEGGLERPFEPIYIYWISSF